MLHYWAVLALAAGAAAPAPRSVQTAAAVEETMHAYGEASARHDSANVELMSALGVATAAEMQLAGASMAASLTTITQAFVGDDLSPPPPPWYVASSEKGLEAPAEKAAEVSARSVATKDSVAKTAAAAAEADARRDEANQALMQATNNAFNLNGVALTERIGASFSWAANGATPDDPLPPPPPVPAAPGYAVGSKVAPVEKALSVETARVQDEAAGEFARATPVGILRRNSNAGAAPAKGCSFPHPPPTQASV